MDSSTLSLLLFSLITAGAIDPAQQNSPQDFLDAHNRARAEVGVQPLAWNDSVADYALRYAQQRYGDCEMEHSMGPYGENLAEGWGRLSAVDAVGMWVSEKSCYDYASNSCVGDECLHYTQVVWRDSTHLGCARRQCRNGWLFVICSYDPPGNYVGQRPY
ncbi:basic form of pathogenesis-related protein 1-like [Salvia miltiorrhiza]|uniref:basic form of pathogenesis-related protein 1-like n=1 Tax=Salvia miltiorrhiza TaxID=226208 RepID=UPI0025AD5BD2|nr:basic form of pathogenesis-related protein 1-like [Salvia miltiorrhiza]